MTAILKGILRPKPYRFEWEVSRFFADCKELGDCYKSPMSASAIPFNDKDKMQFWYLEVYPKGTNEFKDHISLYLCFYTVNTEEMQLTFQCSILNKQNGARTKVRRENFTHKGPSGNGGWGDFVRQDFLKNPENGALIDDTLTIMCEISFDTLQDQHVREGFDEYEALLESSDFTDVTFIMKEKKISLHKVILSMKSPFLKDTFRNDNKTRSIVNVEDVDYDVMKELFRFIYSGKVQNIERIASQLLIAADKYQVIELKALCERVLYEKITVDNALDYLKLTETCQTIHLRRLVIQFIAAHYKDVVEKPGFADLNSKVMHEIIRAIAK